MTRRIQIAVVDSGVRTDHPAFGNKKPDVVRYSGLRDGEGTCGHGTAVYHIISKIESTADIINFQITNREGEIEEDVLIKCLTDIRDNYNVDIINLSLGLSLCENIHQLKSICDDLISKGVVIVSAFDNVDSISYPAGFPGVIGVTSADVCRKKNDFVIFDDTVLNIGAKGNLQRLAWDTPDYIMLDGNSFACAHTTVQAARFLSEGASGFEQIMNKFRETALAVSTNHLTENKKMKTEIMKSEIMESEIMKIKKAILFPFNKEMHSIIRFHDMLSFEVAGVYDIKESARIGSTTAHIMKAEVISYPIKCISDIDWDSFDTIIIGNLPQQGASVFSSARERLIQKAVLLGKNIFSFDDLQEKYDYKYLFCPAVRRTQLPVDRFGKLYRISKPVLGVYGTSSAQGKFTLQLELRRKFQENGYTVGQIGTEPSALLFGMDYVYPMGLNNSVYIGEHDAVRYLNECMNELCQRDCDIILTGSQASVLPFDTGNIGLFPLRQFVFLMGTQPDAVVLCVNPYDELDYIERSIHFLEAGVACEVIAICVFPMTVKKNWSGIYHTKEVLSEAEYQTMKELLTCRFSVPVYRLGDADDITELFENILTFFSGD